MQQLAMLRPLLPGLGEPERTPEFDLYKPKERGVNVVYYSDPVQSALDHFVKGLLNDFMHGFDLDFIAAGKRVDADLPPEKRGNAECQKRVEIRHPIERDVFTALVRTHRLEDDRAVRVEEIEIRLTEKLPSGDESPITPRDMATRERYKETVRKISTGFGLLSEAAKVGGLALVEIVFQIGMAKGMLLFRMPVINLDSTAFVDEKELEAALKEGRLPKLIDDPRNLLERLSGLNLEAYWEDEMGIKL